MSVLFFNRCLRKHQNFSIIALSAEKVPVAKPSKPNNIIKISFTTIHHFSRPSSIYKVKSSIKGGSISAKAQLAKAPVSDIRRSKCGTTKAIPTENKIKIH